MTALRPRKRFAEDTVLIVDGSLVATGDHTLAERSKSCRYSTSRQVVIDAETRLVAVGGRRGRTLVGCVVRGSGVLWEWCG